MATGCQGWPSPRKEFELGTAQFVALLLGIQPGNLGDEGAMDWRGSIAHWPQGLTWGFVAEILGFHMVSYTFPLHLHQNSGSRWFIGNWSSGCRYLRSVSEKCDASLDASRVDRIPEADCSSLRFETWLVGWRLIRAIANFWSR